MIEVDENFTNDPVEICRELNLHFSLIGAKMASKNTCVDVYEAHLAGARQPNSLVLHQANETEIVDEISNRTISGHVG